MNIFCDIDGTLTDDGEHKSGNPLIERIEELRKLSLNNYVVLWSGNGINYAKEFKAKFELHNCIAIGKPHLIIDDNPTIRPNWYKLIKTPNYLDGKV